MTLAVRVEAEDPFLFPEAIDALHATGRRVERRDEALALYRVDDGPELTAGGVIALAFRPGLMVGDGPAQ